MEALWVSWSLKWEASNSVAVSVCMWVCLCFLHVCEHLLVCTYLCMCAYTPPPPAFHVGHGVCVMTPTWSGRSESEMKPDEENEKKSDDSVAESFITM